MFESAAASVYFSTLLKNYIIVEIYHPILLLGSEKFSTKIDDLCPGA